MLHPTAMIALLLAASLLPATLAGENGFAGPHATYTVSCTDGRGHPGRWARMDRSGVTNRKAVLWQAEPPTPPGKNALGPSVLYCNALDGTPGTIVGTNASGFVLPPRTRVQYVRNLEVMGSTTNGRVKNHLEVFPVIGDAYRVRKTATATIVVPNATLMEIFPAGAQVRFDRGGGVGIFRPSSAVAEHKQPKCLLSYRRPDYTVARTRTLPTNCFDALRNYSL